VCGEKDLDLDQYLWNIWITQFEWENETYYERNSSSKDNPHAGGKSCTGTQTERLECG